jgi:hypothetical protein
MLLLGSILPYLFSNRLASILATLFFGVVSGIVALALQAEVLALALISITGFQVFLMTGITNQTEPPSPTSAGESAGGFILWTRNRWVRGTVGLLLSGAMFALLLLFRNGEAPALEVQGLDDFRIGSVGVVFSLMVSVLLLGVINARRR